MKFVSERTGRSAILGQVKNQYFGDINDYKKYGLLRLLAEGGWNRIAVCWMLTAPDGSTAGSRTRYLQQPERWRQFDPELFDLLARAIALKQRQVDFARRRNFIPGAVYHAGLLGDAAATRERYFAGLGASVAGSNLIFFDPDNGMEVKSVLKGRKLSSKYLYWDELKRFYAAGYDVLIYQHFRRNTGQTLEDFLRSLGRELVRMTGAPRIVAFKTAQVIFFLLPQPGICARITALRNSVAERWGTEISTTVYPPDGGRR